MKGDKEVEKTAEANVTWDHNPLTKPLDHNYIFMEETLARTSHVCQLLKERKRRSVCKNFALMNEAFLHCIVAVQHNRRYPSKVQTEDLGGEKRIQIVNAVTTNENVKK